MSRWPVSLVSMASDTPAIVLRPLRRRDRSAWLALRAANADWTRPWDATSPTGIPDQVSFGRYVRHLDREARAGRGYAFVIESSDPRLAGSAGPALVGQLHLYGVSLGSLMSGAIGYWVAEPMAGRGIATLAVALAGDWALGDLGLHRVEVTIRPENTASLRVATKLGLREEGVRVRYLHIDGAWRDHRAFAVTAEEVRQRSLISRITRVT